MHYRHRQRATAVSPAAYSAAWDFLCGRRASPSLATAAPPPPPPLSHEPASSPVGSPTAGIVNLPLNINLRGVGAGALRDFWASFDPGLPEDDVPPPPPELPDDFAWDLRLRTAPWGVDDWELPPTPPPSDGTGDDNPSDGEDDSASLSSELSLLSFSSLPSSRPSTPSLPSSQGDFSGAPQLVRLRAGAVDLLRPEVYRFPQEAEIRPQGVDPWPPLRLRSSSDMDWLHRTTTVGVNLPRPFGAPHLFIPTRPSPLMDRMIAAWEEAGLLINYPNLTCAFPMFLIPKADNSIRAIIDYSQWTWYIETPRFSLLTAGSALRSLPPGFLLIKIDLKSGFHQLRINPLHRKFNGVFYRGRKLALTRLPMGHAVAPGVFQRACVALLSHVAAVCQVRFVAYLDDWLLAAPSAEPLRWAVETIQQLGVSINLEKSMLQPATVLSYLGFRVNTVDCSLQVEPPVVRRLQSLLQLVRPGSEKDRQRIHGYATWILFNIRWPLFLAADILRGDAAWLQAALSVMDVNAPHRMGDALITLHLFTDATPHSVAAFIPALDKGFAQAFQEAAEISHAEMVAALLGLRWAAQLVTETHIVLHTDNAAVYCSLRSGKGRVFRRHDVRRLFLSVLCELRDNTWEVQPLRSAENPADAPSRDILRTLHDAARNPDDFQLARDYGDVEERRAVVHRPPSPPIQLNLQQWHLRCAFCFGAPARPCPHHD